MITVGNCPVCNSLKFKTKIECVDYTYSKDIFNIVSCETCGFLITSPRPHDDNIGEYYKSESYISHTNSSSGLFNWMYQAARHYSIKKKVGFLKNLCPQGTHLDVGCGTGEFLNACKKSGFRTIGIEPSSIARKQAVENFGLKVKKNTDLKQFEKSSFDTISMWHVLEHVAKLNQTVSQLARILRPGGAILVAVPNHKSWDANYYKEHWAAWDVPIHLWHFSERTIENLFCKHGFCLTEKKPMLFDSYYVSLLSEEFRHGRKKFFKSLIIGAISNIVGLITKRGCSSTMYIFKKRI